MKRIILYCFILLVALSGCEDIYNPEIEKVESALVVDARIEASKTDSYIKLTKSLGFNESEQGYPPVTGATVTLISNNNQSYKIPESSAGIYPVNFRLNPELEYKLKIESSGNVYESSFEPVPKIPNLDTVFGVPEKKLFLQGGENNISNAIEKEGVQLYSNILNEKEMPYYKFTARKILEYSYQIQVGDMELVVYGWRSHFPIGTFNIAAPPEFSVATDIIKHPLYFMSKKPFLATNHEYNNIPQKGKTYFLGWIIIIKQYGLSNSGYNYYKDLNSQLSSDGRLFDPLYVQANNNLKCTSDPEQLVLGNFEISREKEHRFYVRYASEEIGYYIFPINKFYEIPLQGESIQFPEFWEPSGN